MLICLAFVTAAAIVFIACFTSAEKVGPKSIKWTGIEPWELAGLYVLRWSDTTNDLMGPQQCIQSITIEKVKRLSFASWGVPHDRIRQEGVRCSSDGMMIAISRNAIERSGASEFILREQPLKPLAEVLDKLHIHFFVGVEQTDRVCGDSVTPAFSLAVFLRMPKGNYIPSVSSNASIPDVIGTPLFRQGVKYMVVYHGGEKLCIYVGISGSTPEAAELSPSMEASEQFESETDAPSVEPELSSILTPGIASLLATPILPSEIPITTVSPQPSALASASASAYTSDFLDDASMTAMSIASLIEWDDSLKSQTTEPNSVTVEPSQDATQEGENGSDPACFPVDAHVTLANGRTVRMDALSPGMTVVTGQGTSSHVHGFSHRNTGDALHKFVQLITIDGSKLTATGGHYVYKSKRGDSKERFTLVSMNEIRIGDYLLRHNGKRSMVDDIQTVWKRGLINPHTLNGDIVVDGFIASCYTRHVGFFTSQALLAPLRAAFRITGTCASVFNNGIPSWMSRWIFKVRANASTYMSVNAYRHRMRTNA